MERERSIFLAKAEECLSAATHDYDGGRYNSCANRCCYACFQGAIAALIFAGVTPIGQRKQWGHEFVQSEFVKRLINQRKLFAGAFRDYLQANFRLRQVADYTADDVTEIQARRALRRSAAFLAVVRELGG